MCARKNTGQNFFGSLKILRVLAVTHCLVIPTKNIQIKSRNPWCYIHSSDLGSDALKILFISIRSYAAECYSAHSGIVVEGLCYRALSLATCAVRDILPLLC